MTTAAADLQNAPATAGEYARLVFEARSGLGADVATAQSLVARALLASNTVFQAGPFSSASPAGALDVTGLQDAQVFDVRVRATADAAKFGSWRAALASDGLDDPGAFFSVQGNVPLLVVAPDTPADPPGLAATSAAKAVAAAAPATLAQAASNASTTLRWVALAAALGAVAYLVGKLPTFGRTRAA